MSCDHQSSHHVKAKDSAICAFVSDVPNLAVPSLRRRSGCARRRLWRTAFTLTELMVVIVIIGLLAGAVTLSVRSYLISSKQNVARMEIAKISEALNTFYAQYDRYPSNDEGIDLLCRPSEKFADGLLSKVPVDPWGNPYEYIHPGRSKPFEVMCYGADGREGGTAADTDISSVDLSN